MVGSDQNGRLPAGFEGTRFVSVLQVTATFEPSGFDTAATLPEWDSGPAPGPRPGGASATLTLPSVLQKCSDPDKLMHGTVDACGFTAAQRLELAMSAGSVRNIVVDVPMTTGYLRGICAGVRRYAQLHPRYRLSLDIYGAAWPMAIQPETADGVIGIYSQEQGLKIARQLGRPVVSIGTAAVWRRLPSVHCDNRQVAELAVDLYAAQGQRDVAFCGDRSQPASVQRREEFCKTASGRGLRVHVDDRPRLTRLDPQQWRKVQDDLIAWLLSLPRPCGVLAYDDPLATEIAQAARSAGVSVPEEIALLGVNDDQLVCEMTDPPLSSIRVEGDVLGFRAAELLAHLMDGGRPPDGPVLIPPSGVTLRRSTEVLHTGDPLISQAILRIRREAPNQAMTASELIGDLPISRRAFYQRFTKVLGHGPGQEIARVRIARACELLETSNFSIKEIALTMGFESSNIFSRFFRNQTGQTPLEHRRQAADQR